MGTFSVTIEVAGSDTGRFMTAEALVDTGATHTLLPRDLPLKLGVKPIERIPFQLAPNSSGLADDRTVEYEIGEARLRLDGRERTTLVIFGSEGTVPLLGATTLELFNMAVDPVRQRLIPVPGLLKQLVTVLDQNFVLD